MFGFVFGIVSRLALVRVRFVSDSCLGSCPGSCPVRVWLVFGFLSGSRPVRVWFVSASCLVRIWVHIWVRVRVRVWFASGSRLGSCLVGVWFVSGSGSCPGLRLVHVRVRIRFLVVVRVWFGFVAGSGLFRAYFVCGGLVFGFVFRFVFGSYLVRVFVLVDSRKIWGIDIYFEIL